MSSPDPDDTADDTADIDALSKLSAFGALSPEAVRFLATGAEEVAVPAGEVFFEQGDSGDGVYVMRHGRVAMVRNVGERSLVLAELGDGALFGEIALIGISPRTATARAIEDSVALRMPNRLLYELSRRHLEDFALLQMNLAREVARRLTIANQTLCEHLGRGDAG